MRRCLQFIYPLSLFLLLASLFVLPSNGNKEEGDYALPSFREGGREKTQNRGRTNSRGSARNLKRAIVHSKLRRCVWVRALPSSAGCLRDVEQAVFTVLFGDAAMKFLSFRKVTQGTALAVFLAAFYAAVLLLGWPPLRMDSSQTALIADDTQDGGARRDGASAPKKLVFLKSAPGFHERVPQSINVRANVVDYSDQASGEDLEGGGRSDADNNNRSGPGRTSETTTRLEDLFLSVKTTRTFHQVRLDAILRTWFVLAREQTYFFSDFTDPLYQIKTNGHLINTNCSSSHNRKALCCKMSVELDYFLDSNKKWMCHFDDDNYVNVPRLVRLLQGYDPREDWYLGKPSIRQPLEILARDKGSRQKKISFWFATGGAGFCISRSLALKMLPIAGGGKFISIGEHIRLPDDVTMGYIIEHLLKKNLTVVDNFHSHLEPMKFLKKESLADQVTFSYSKFGKEMNVLSIDGFPDRVDPTRFLSLHCHLFPNFSFCPR